MVRNAKHSSCRPAGQLLDLQQRSKRELWPALRRERTVSFVASQLAQLLHAAQNPSYKALSVAKHSAFLSKE